MDETAFQKQATNRRCFRYRCNHLAIGMNLGIFEEWLRFFSRSVPASIPRPLVLILDGCGSHYSTDVVKVADALDILLVFLPPNGTQLLQPLDIAVFTTHKSKIHNMISELVEEEDDGHFNISKDDAIKVASLTWGGSKVGRNLERGFKACGLFRYRWSG
ncbi:unnamed protein product [Phytophthora fragariaefolia]|uniref:Unnamed protein product n=1 Tax=Phytophthora fragariaefolia TaxID=1490495 RepID=A0A9W7D2M6_9STRA|nr:unnamed protein product [Phytophthora fragariaefolia]